MLSEGVRNSIIVGVVTGSLLATGGVIYGTVIILPQMQEQIKNLDNKISDKATRGDEHLDAERTRSTVIDNNTTEWLSRVNARSLSNVERIKALETLEGIYHKSSKKQ